MNIIRRLYISFFTVGFFNLGLMIFVPYYSAYLSGLGFSNSTISFIFAGTPLASIVIAPILGTISDHIGRKKVILFGLLLEIFALSLLLYLPKSLIFMICLITMISIATMIVEMTIISLAQDRFVNKNRGTFTGIFESIRSIGVVAGPLLGSFLVSISSIETNFKIGLLIFMAILVISLFLREEKVTPKKPLRADFNFIKEIHGFLKNQDLRAVGILGATANLAHNGKNIFIPLFILQVLKAPLKYVGIFAAISMAMNLFQFVFGWLCDKFGSKYLIILGTSINALGYFLIFFVDSIYSLLAVGIFISLGSSMWNTAAWTFMSNIAEKEKKEGMVVGSYGAVANKGIFLGYLLSGFVVYYTGIRFIFVIYGCIVLTGVVYAYMNIFRKKIPQKSPLFEPESL